MQKDWSLHRLPRDPIRASFFFGAPSMPLLEWTNSATEIPKRRGVSDVEFPARRDGRL